MYFRLHVSAEKYQSYYQGSAKAVIVTAEDGRTIKFPASALQKFDQHTGIQGRFEIIFDEQYKLVSLNRV